MERTQTQTHLQVGDVVSWPARWGTAYGTVLDLGEGAAPGDYDYGWTPLVADTCGFLSRMWHERLTVVAGPHSLRDRNR